MKVEDTFEELDGDHTGMNLWALDEDKRRDIFARRAARAARQRLAEIAASRPCEAA